MLLVFDVGNTNTVIGLFDFETGDLVDHWRASTDQLRTGDEWHMTLDGFLGQRDTRLAEMEQVIVGSVVPAVTGSLQRMAARLQLSVVTVDPTIDTGVPIRIENPLEAGADRIANAVAVVDKGLLPAIVVDMGTATTLDVVDVNGAYIGGVIMPGLGISMDALVDRASALRSVPIQVPPNVIGTTTRTAVQSGATYGYAAQVDGLCAQIEKEIGACTVYATGGLSSLITSISSRITQQDPWLTLRGFALIALRLRNNA